MSLKLRKVNKPEPPPSISLSPANLTGKKKYFEPCDDGLLFLQSLIKQIFINERLVRGISMYEGILKY